VPLARIVVVDDCSTDCTAAIAVLNGAEVIQRPCNGGKAAAQNAGLATVATPYTLMVDADTQLAPDALAQLLPSLEDARIGVVCAYVLPQGSTTLWERGRFIEYILGQAIYKSGQHRLRSVLVAAGCCSLYRTALLRDAGGFRGTTMTEDLDMAWILFERGYTTAFASKSRCFTAEPTTQQMYLRQLDRWYRGMFQVLALHRFTGVWRLKMLAYWYAVDALLSPVLLGLLVWHATRSPWLTLGGAVLADLGIAAVVAVCAEPRQAGRVVRCLPAYLLVRQYNMFAYVRAFYRERLRQQHLTLWHKGHAE
jgi:biofilm PGA synthesis N-glycosyltransferase PgaC